MENILNTTQNIGMQNESSLFLSVNNIFISLLTAFLLGMLFSLLYSKIQKNVMISSNFSHTLVILPITITTIIFFVGNNIAGAFYLAGAFSLIRFRSASAIPKDLTFILSSMAIGLACGTGHIFYAIIITLLIAAVLIFLEFFEIGNTPKSNKILKITVT